MIGNTYAAENEKSGQSPLPQCADDANAMEATLKACDFTVKKYIDLNLKDMMDKFNKFTGSLMEDDVVLMYFSGHGLEYRGEQFFIPVNMKEPDEPFKIRSTAFNCDTAKSHLHQRVDSGLKFIFCDCCRSET